MKTTMEKLMAIQNNPSAYGLKKGMLAYEAIGKLINYKMVHSVSVSGSGRYTHLNVYTTTLTMALAKAGIPFRVGNDAPRCGKHGEYVAVDVKSFKPLKYDAELYKYVYVDGVARIVAK